jgi:transaldolase
LRIFIDSASLADIERYNDDPAISGFTTNATLVKNAGADVQKLVDTARKEISVEFGSCEWAPNVRWKITSIEQAFELEQHEPINLTAICSPRQVPARLRWDSIISVFAGRVMDTGRSPANLITLAKRTGAQVLWASSRAVYDITLAEILGCDIITVTPAIYEKHREWHGKPLEEVAALTIAQFERDRA